jgi:hypothetical protein
MRKVEFAAGIVFALQRDQALPSIHFVWSLPQRKFL